MKKHLIGIIKSLATSSPPLTGQKITGVSMPGYTDKPNWGANR
jgi:hypothetical protein